MEYTDEDISLANDSGNVGWSPEDDKTELKFRIVRQCLSGVNVDVNHLKFQECTFARVGPRRISI